MLGHGSRSDFLVNAEVDSMGGVVDGGVGSGFKTSPRRAAIEKAQVELRLEYDVREERRRELEFLEKGGNPLDFKFSNAASISVQSTSLTDHQAEHVVTSKAKGSFALTASPRGDSVESSGRPGPTTVCEPNSADNFDGQNNSLGGERNRKLPSRRNSVVPSEQSSQIEETRNAKESEDSAIVRPYARRNRSKKNRDGARSSSGDVVQSSGGHGSSLPLRGGSRNIKLVSAPNSQKETTFPSGSKPKPTPSNGEMVSQRVEEPVQALQVTDAPKSSPMDEMDVSVFCFVKDVGKEEEDQPAEVNTQKQPADDMIRILNENGGNEQVISVCMEFLPCAAVEKSDVEAGPAQLNDLCDLRVNDDTGQNGATNAIKGLDSGSSCTPNSLSLDVNIGSNLCNSRSEDDSKRVVLKQAAELEGARNSVVAQTGKVRNDDAVENNTSGDAVVNPAPVNSSADVTTVKTEDIRKSSGPLSEAKCTSDLGDTHKNQCTAPVIDEKLINLLDNELISSRGNLSPCRTEYSADFSSQHGQPRFKLTEKISASAAGPHSAPEGDIKMDRAREDSILDEARSIEAKRKRLAELSVGTVQLESRKKSHWDFVLEEMIWLANDFAQERLWKITAAAQICRRVALTSRSRAEERNECWKLKKVSYTIAKAVMQFWESAEVVASCDRNLGPKSCFDKNDPAMGKDACRESEQRSPRNKGIRGYAVRFLKFNSSLVTALEAEPPATPDVIGDSGIVEISWNDHLTEESLFYAVPSGAMDSYKRSIESYLVQFEKTGSSMPEEGDTSMVDAGADLRYAENGYDEDEGETSTLYLHGAFESSRPTKHDHKKRKVSMKSFPARSYEVGAYLPYATVGLQQNSLMGKRPSSNLGPIPPKRMRTASRQRVISPFGTEVTVGPSAPVNADASSGDTSSFQDDESTLHGGLQLQKGTEVNSVGEFEKHPSYNCSDIVTKPKKKKARNLGAYEQSWQVDSSILVEQRENAKKRLMNHHFDSNGTSGLYGQHTWKKPKMLKQPLDAFDNVAGSSGSIPSPVASQMSNMPTTNRFMRLINGRDKGRKPKSLKIPAGQPGCGSPWSLFEDQALVVLVHDMGPNWEFVSDAINSTLHFKCIFRDPKECKERHKILMDKGAGDGADSAEDSEISQSYPSTLPGIPKGSARQLFQRLQGPMEEETLKSHFEKILMIGKKLHCRSRQNDNQNPKQIPVHNSHIIALSQAFPNNLNGDVLMPIELCEVNPSSPDVPIPGYQGSHASGSPIPIPSQSVVGSMLPASGASPPVQGTSSMVLGNNSPSPSGPLPTPVRDCRFSAPKTSVRTHEHKKMQHYNQMLSGRNMQQQQPNLSVSGTLPGGNGMGMMPGLNRNMPLSRPGFQGITSQLPNASSMLPSSVAGVPGGVNMHSGTGSGQMNSLMRPREPLHIMRTYPGHQQPQHQMSLQQSQLANNPHIPGQTQHATASQQQQAYAIRLAKERQMQQRFLQQQQQFAASNSIIPHGHPQPQLPTTSLPMQNNCHIPPQTSVPLSPVSQSSPLTPMSSQQQKVNPTTHHGLTRIPQQQPRQQQLQQSGRNHLQQRQQAQSSQQKPVKVGRGNMMVHQNLPVDHSHMNGVPMPTVNKGAEKAQGDHAVHLMQGQGLYPGSQSAPLRPPSKAVVSPQPTNHSQSQQKHFPASSHHSSKQLQQMPSYSDNNSQGQVPSLSAGHSQLASHQAVTSAVTPSTQPHQKQVNQAQSAVQRMLHQNRQKNSGLLTKSQPDQSRSGRQSHNHVQQTATSETLAIPMASNDSANVVSLGSHSVLSRRASEPLSDSTKLGPATQKGSIRDDQSLQNPAGSEPVASTSQGLGQRQLSGSLAQRGQNTAAKRQQQMQPEVQKSTPPTTPRGQILQPQEQLLQQEQLSQQFEPSQQLAHLQTAQGSLYSGPTDTNLE